MKVIPLFDVDECDAAVSKKIVKAMLENTPMVRRVRVLPAPKLLGKKWIAVETTNNEKAEVELAAVIALKNLVRYTLRREIAR